MCIGEVCLPHTIQGTLDSGRFEAERRLLMALRGGGLSSGLTTDATGSGPGPGADGSAEAEAGTVAALPTPEGVESSILGAASADRLAGFAVFFAVFFAAVEAVLAFAAGSGAIAAAAFRWSAVINHSQKGVLTSIGL